MHISISGTYFLVLQLKIVKFKFFSSDMSGVHVKLTLCALCKEKCNFLNFSLTFLLSSPYGILQFIPKLESPFLSC